MVFSSIPLYLDPFNWQQQQQGGGNHETSHLQPSVQPTQVLGGVGGGTATSIGPNSTAERARLAKITQPEAPLKCPRCESTNTKFCYFNNYSLSQPRHFCRTCRRYWTRGGTLRNVPVGGGCRRNNKRSKNDRLKPPVTATTPTADRKQQEGLAASSSTAASSIIELIGGHFLQPTPQLSFVDSLQNLTQLGVGKSGSNFEGMIQPEVPNFSMVNNTISGASQQFPFLGGGFEVSLSTYPFQNASFTEASWTSYGAGSVHNGINMRSRTTSSTGLISHLEPLKMEENQGLRDSKQLVGTPENNQSWVSASNATVWTDLSGLNSSSCTSHIL